MKAAMPAKSSKGVLGERLRRGSIGKESPFMSNESPWKPKYSEAESKELTADPVRVGTAVLSLGDAWSFSCSKASNSAKRTIRELHRRMKTAMLTYPVLETFEPVLGFLGINGGGLGH